LPARSPGLPSPQARRQALRESLALALAQRDAAALQRLTSQWVHRQGVNALAPLMAELAEGESLLWWQGLLQPEQSLPEQPVAVDRPLPLSPAPQRPVAVSLPPAAARQVRPAPAPGHPALAPLRAWLPDAPENSFSPENSRAA